MHRFRQQNGLGRHPCRSKFRLKAMTTYVPPAVAASILGVSTSTLRQYATAHGLGFIKTPGGQKRFDISDIPKATPEKKDAIYARMSSKKQEDDLERQITSLQDALQG